MTKNKKLIFNKLCCYLIVFIQSLVFASVSFSADKVYYYHTDHVGTPMSMTDSSGTTVWEADYLPFGEESEITVSTENKQRFVGKEKDEETDLYYFGARYLDARTGRFTKPDPVGIRESDLINPQKFNRYNYSLNNPFKYIDSDGREVFLTSHHVAFGARHTALYLVPDNQSHNLGLMGFKKNQQGQWYITLSAGPDSILNPKLKSDVNRPTDAPDKNTIDHTIENPFGNSVADDTKFIENLISRDSSYSDKSDYDIIPEIQDGYNSNSYTSGLLNSVGAKVPKLNGNSPGINKPIPSDNFKIKKKP